LKVKKNQNYVSNYSWDTKKESVIKTLARATKDKNVKQKTFIGDILMDYYFVDGQPLEEKNPKWLQDDYVKFLRFAQWKIQTAGYGIVGMITNHSYLDNPTFRGMRQSLIKTFDEIYILDLHGNSLKKETTPDGGKDENVFDIRQGVAIAIFIKNKKAKKSTVYHADLFGLRENKYKSLDENEFSVKNYKNIRPESPYYFLVKRDTGNIKQYLNWKKINEIFTINSVGIVTSRDKFVISHNKSELKNRILQFTNLSQSDEIISEAFQLRNKSNWKIKDARNNLANTNDIYKSIREILYRPFDKRYIFYHKALIERMRPEVMRHMLEENIALIMPKRVETKIPWQHCFCGKGIIDHVAVSLKTIDYVFPLYIYPNKNNKDIFNQHQTEKEPNIPQALFVKLKSVYGRKPTPEQILYYIYGIFYSNIYREAYAEFLKIDFPRVPFTADYKLFLEIRKLGKELTDLHLLKSPTLDPPVAKYQGTGEDDRIEKIVYKEKEGRVYINKDKYFEGVKPDVWHYNIGGYQVLNKYLKDRKKRIMADAPHYCRIVTALNKTIEIQKMIDAIYPEIEKELIDFS